MEGQNPHTLEYTSDIGIKVGIFHYTCNPPSKEILNKFIKKYFFISLGCNDDREVLLIPHKLLRKKGIRFPLDNIILDNIILKLTLENLLRKLN